MGGSPRKRIPAFTQAQEHPPRGPLTCAALKFGQVQAYAHLGLYVTWTPVEAAKRDGVENFLANQLKSLVAERCFDCKPISVNLPW